MYDVIGDIHGQFGKLEALLKSLGYVEKQGAFRHPLGRKAVFVGDLIDRGPEQVRVVQTVRKMVDAGSARCILGNHEWNAIGYVTRRPDGSGERGWLRKHSPKNVAQHAEFLKQVGEGSELHRDLVTWFMTLPPVLDLGAIRVAHAWWNDGLVAAVRSRLKAGEAMDEQFLLDAYTDGTPEYRAMEGLTKGLEMHLPDGVSFFDHGGVERFDARIKWWKPSARTYAEVAILPEGCGGEALDHPLKEPIPSMADDAPPTFVGHYWFVGQPKVQSARVAVLDYSAARSGPLVAYRWEGEPDLHDGGFVLAGL